MLENSIGVLLVDDHGPVLDGLRSLLEAHGFRVIGRAGDGVEAVRLAGRLRPEIAILDITLPRMNGIEAARRIREVSPSTRILMLSAHASSFHVESALRAGAHGYVVKESLGRELIEAVTTLVAGESYVSESLIASTPRL